ncbi:MAG: hypothetical protein ACFCVD_12650 [Nodosilinea sp.]
MKKRCLPCHLIVRNVCLILVLLVSSLVVSAKIHADANLADQKAAALRRLFVYQVMTNMEPE